jgi:hypothetical protein
MTMILKNIKIMAIDDEDNYYNYENHYGYFDYYDYDYFNIRNIVMEVHAFSNSTCAPRVVGCSDAQCSF